MHSGRKPTGTSANLINEFNKVKKLADHHAANASLFHKSKNAGSVGLSFNNVDIHLHEHGSSLSFIEDFHGNGALYSDGTGLCIQLNDSSVKNSDAAFAKQFQSRQSAVNALTEAANLSQQSTCGSIDLSLVYCNTDIHIAKTGHGSLNLDVTGNAYVDLNRNNVLIEIYSNAMLFGPKPVSIDKDSLDSEIENCLGALKI
jgi:hypothetical protein